MELKKAYYYVICLAALYFLFWGAIDLANSAVGLAFNRGQQAAAEPAGDQYLDAFYQKKMMVDRLWDGAARCLVAGGIFIYCRRRADELEG